MEVKEVGMHELPGPFNCAGIIQGNFGLHNHVSIQTGGTQVRMLIDSAQKSLPTGIYPVKLDHLLLLTYFYIARVSLTVILELEGGS